MTAGGRGAAPFKEFVLKFLFWLPNLCSAIGCNLVSMAPRERLRSFNLLQKYFFCATQRRKNKTFQIRKNTDFDFLTFSKILFLAFEPRRGSSVGRASFKGPSLLQLY